MIIAAAPSLSGVFPFSRGRYRVEAGRGDAFLDPTLPLRRQVFRAGLRADTDRFDADCLHVAVQDIAGGQIVCSFRALLLQPKQVGQSYSAQSYGLQPLAEFGAPLLELGRFALHPAWHDPDILRLAWAAIARLVDAQGVGMLFGCSSFQGADAQPHRAALALLGARHLGPAQWRPDPIAPERLSFATEPAEASLDLRAGVSQMPVLLRSYLTLGGWVSDHAVPDLDLDTLHVFTAVEIAAIPPARARALREIARSGD